MTSVDREARNTHSPERRLRRAFLIVLLLSLGCLYLHSLGQERNCRVAVSLIDANTKKPLSGVIRCTLQATGEVIPIPGLLNRGQGVGVVDRLQGRTTPEKIPIRDWYVLPGPAEIDLPRQPVKLEAFSGLETERTEVSIDLSAKTRDSQALALRSFSQTQQRAWFAGNTHLHLYGLTRPEADRYLAEVPQADRLDVLFTSHLLRPSEDASYVSNQYPIGDLKGLGGTRVLMNNGEEHRNNFKAYGPGYGHVMFLNIKQLVQPVSIGPGITGKGTDGVPLQQGIDEAHRQGGTTIWCHNGAGTERVPNFVSGKVDAQNIFDGNAQERYEDTFYHYLNAGLRVPFSTGTDWFLYDLSRVYARVRGSLGIQSWLDALEAGRTFITNGPLLDLKVGGKDIGEIVRLGAAGDVAVEGRATGRVDFETLELVQNGKIVSAVRTEPSRNHYVASIRQKVRIESSAWLALRISSGKSNEYGRRLFAHTSAVYLEVGGKGLRMPQEVDFLVKETEQARDLVAAKAVFASSEERQRVLAVYENALNLLRKSPKAALDR